MELFKAHEQWKNRPADERYWDIAEMAIAAKTVKAQARELERPLSELRVEATEGDLMLVGRQGVPAQVSHYAFGQLATRVGAPASYIRGLPTTLAAQNLNHGLKSLAAERVTDAKLLFNVNGSLALRAVTTTKYARVWNADILDRVQAALPPSWKTPRAWPARVTGERTRPATEDDVMSGSIIQLGDTIAPAGAYLSDKDMFLFLVDTESEIVDGTPHPMHRGVMLWNSEVGARSFGGMTFFLKAACGNHRVMGATNVTEFSHRHIGNVDAALDESFEVTFKQICNESTSDVEAKIVRERSMILGANKAEVLDAVLAFAKKRKIDRINHKLLEAAFDQAVIHESWYGNPHSVYGIVMGSRKLRRRCRRTWMSAWRLISRRLKFWKWRFDPRFREQTLRSPFRGQEAFVPDGSWNTIVDSA